MSWEELSTTSSMRSTSWEGTFSEGGEGMKMKEVMG
eukprot:CAMPEP_0170551366 /NCGR_PEP_ID=MMETSP0211-20121228/9371_1 /TAXON_ID=311385 /ORGANISM="Pseudokeronopsis sp., Strain OXSARD2" /LENGTH=35 /DNA_ID= /DNA_START= /DNA_END= /DNA_ORIENTATION=